MIFMLPALVILIIICCVTHLYACSAAQQFGIFISTEQIKPLRHEDTTSHEASVRLRVFVSSWFNELNHHSFYK